MSATATTGFQVLERGLRFPEGPRWRAGRLYYSDMYAGEVRALDLDGRAEVVARVQAVLRRSRRTPSARMLDFGRVRINVTAREVCVDGRPVPLALREFDLLHLLARHPRRAFGREELFQRLWGEYGDRHTVTVHVARIREKIEQDAANPTLVVTVRGVGYRFEGEPV